MNSKERVKRAFHFNRPDRVPLSCISLQSDFFVVIHIEPRSWQPTQYPPHVMGGAITYSNPIFRWLGYSWNKSIRKKLGYPRKWWNYPHKSIDEWGVIWQSSGMKNKDKTMGHVIKGPLQDGWDNLDDLEIPDANDDSRYRFAKSGIFHALGKKKYVLGSMGADGLFHRCCHIRGFNNFLVDLGRNPKQAHMLFDKILPFYLTHIEKYKEYYPHLDAIVIADDLGTQKSPFISPRLFKKFLAPRYEKIIKLTHDLGMDFVLHSCGEIYDLIQPLIDIGVDVLEFDSPHMTGVENFKHFAEERKIAFWLSSNIQSTYTQGTPEEVEEEIKYYIKEVGNNEGGLAIYEYPQNSSLGTPKKNIIAQRKAVKKWGKYDDNGKIEWLK
ncbi:MAG: uroporphyrinogen decarboxylase family protein [Promethearchaeota archaeon]